MDSLYETCVRFTTLVLQPSDIILHGGGFVLPHDLAIQIADVVSDMDHLLCLASEQRKLSAPPFIGQTELLVLTSTIGYIAPATQNQIVWNWITIIDKLYIAMKDLRSLYKGRPLYGISITKAGDAVRQMAQAHEHGKTRSHSRWPLRGSHGQWNCAEAGGLTSSRPPRRATSIPAVAAPDDISQATHEPEAAHVPHDLFPVVPSSQRNISMADLFFAYKHASAPDLSLSARTRRIVSKKFLNESDITDRSEDLDPPYSGQFALEQHLFLSIESTVREMQSLLTAAFSFVNGRPVCFIVDPHGVLLAMLRGASCIDELQVAWKGLRKRVEIARLEFDGDSAGVTDSSKPVPVHECSVACKMNVGKRSNELGACNRSPAPPPSGSLGFPSFLWNNSLAGSPKPLGADGTRTQVIRQGPRPGETVSQAMDTATFTTQEFAPEADQIPPLSSHSDPSYPSTHERCAAAEVESSQRGGLDKYVQERAKNFGTASVRTVELGGRTDAPAAVFQQDFTSKIETCTLPNLKDASSRDVLDLVCTTPSSILPLCSTVLLPCAIFPPAPSIAANETAAIPCCEGSASAPGVGYADTLQHTEDAPAVDTSSPGVHSASAQTSAPAVTRQTLTPGVTRSVADWIHIRTLRTVKAEGQGPGVWSKSRSRDDDTEYTPANAVSRLLPTPTAVEIPAIPAADRVMLFVPARESDHRAAAENDGGRGRSADEKLRQRESPASATCTSRGASTPQSAGTGTATGEQQPASDLELQKIAIDLEAEIGGQADEQSERVFIVSARHEVILPPPTPVLAFCECAVELGGQIVGQQDFISNAGPRTFDELKDASICEPAYFSSVTCCVPLHHLSVHSSVTPLSKTSALVSAVGWTHKVSYLGLLAVSSSEPNLVWAREGIGTLP
ncbi:hypothetical protein B0H14DRAFT_3521539 [Mycena olivaceomarginata]|nr:hypothetical protein B0H14DRAFT_3521539 [Mycena olivaceomarginata]